jgi:hypothetical protein
MFGPRRVLCPAGRWTRIISNFGTGYPRRFIVQLATDDGSAVDGEFIEKRALWVFPQPPVNGRLAQSMQFRRHWINAVYSVSIRPTADTVAVVD